MGKVTVKVEIPSKKPDEMLTLAEKLAKRNAELADKSPISSLNMSA